MGMATRVPIVENIKPAMILVPRPVQKGSSRVSGSMPPMVVIEVEKIGLKRE